LNQIISLQNSEIQGYQQISQDTFSISVAYVTIAALIGVVVVYVVMRSLSGIIIRAMVRLAHVAERISEGDLSESVERRNFYRKGNEELQTLINSMDKMQRSLTNLVLEVRENANGVAIASLQIAAGNNDLSERTDKQARSVQNTTASVGEFKDMIQSTASSAREASGLADKASQIAECGGEVVGRVVSTMHNITNSSKKSAIL
jgi:methyl-accepting chemotaxis protein